MVKTILNIIGVFCNSIVIGYMLISDLFRNLFNINCTLRLLSVDKMNQTKLSASLYPGLQSRLYQVISDVELSNFRLSHSSDGLTDNEINYFRNLNIGLVENYLNGIGCSCLLIELRNNNDVGSISKYRLVANDHLFITKHVDEWYLISVDVYNGVTILNSPTFNHKCATFEGVKNLFSDIIS